MIIIVLFCIQFSNTVSDLKDFAKTPVLTTSILGPFQKEATAPIMMDITGIDVLYHSIIQHRPISTATSMVIDKTESVPSTISVMEPDNGTD